MPDAIRIPVCNVTLPAVEPLPSTEFPPKAKWAVIDTPTRATLLGSSRMVFHSNPVTMRTFPGGIEGVPSTIGGQHHEVAALSTLSDPFASIVRRTLSYQWHRRC